MTSIRWTCAAVFLSGLCGLAAAQSQALSPRLTDVGPPPAEERDSVGAIVLEHSMVRAQRAKAFAESAGRTGVGTVASGSLRARTRAATQAELATARAAEAAELQRMGAGALTGR